MKMLVTLIESKNISGTSKAGKAYHIDNTTITVSVPVDTPESFGTKEISYQYGNAANFENVKNLRGQLPLECDIELGAVLNSYGGVDTVISSIKPPASYMTKGA